MAELAPKERRGSLSTLFQLMVTFGILLAYASNLGFLNHNLFGIRDWRWMLGSALVPAALLLLGGLLLPESPRYLVNKGDTRNAFKVLTLIRKDVDQTQVQIELTKSRPWPHRTPRVVCANCSVSLVRRWWPPSVSCCSSSSWASTR